MSCQERFSDTQLTRFILANAGGYFGESDPTLIRELGEVIYLSPNINIPENNVKTVGFGPHNNTKDDIINYLSNIEKDSISYILSVRVLEHFGWNDLKYLMYLCYNALKPNGRMIHVVPDMKKMAEEFKIEDSFDIEKLNLEIYNMDEPYDRHLCFTSKDIMEKLLTMENYFTVDKDEIEYYNIDGSRNNVLIAAQSTKSEDKYIHQ